MEVKVKNTYGGIIDMRVTFTFIQMYPGGQQGQVTTSVQPFYDMAIDDEETVGDVLLKNSAGGNKWFVGYKVEYAAIPGVWFPVGQDHRGGFHVNLPGAGGNNQ
jgi:hypothetical protein